MATGLGRQVMEEQREWREFAETTFGQGAWLHGVSSLDSDRRVYRYGNRVAKVRRRQGSIEEQDARQFGQDVRREWEVLDHLDRVGRCGLDARYERLREWEWIDFRFREGIPLSEARVGKGVLGRLMLLLKAARRVLEYNLHGVMHGDVVPNNLIVDSKGDVDLVDFGNAKIRGVTRALLEEWWVILFGRHGLVARTGKEIVLLCLPCLQRVYRRMRMRDSRPFTTAGASDPNLQVMEEAWRGSARWHTSLGSWLNYSSITVGGTHFPGQRPWLLRWNQISERLVFKGKRVLDLGCNLGLLSSFASLAGATDCRAFEADPSLVHAARKIAQALGASVVFESVDIDCLHRDDERVQGVQVVVAMSIMEWVKDKDNLLALIGLADEALYEGHEPVQIEMDRLKRVGFRSFELIAVSERGRYILHARKR